MKPLLTLLSVLCIGCQRVGRIAESTPTFTVGKSESTFDEREYTMTATITTPITASGDGIYLAVFQVVRTRLDPSLTTDTLETVALVRDRKAELQVTDFVSLCTQYTSTDCVRRTRDPAFSITPIAYVQMQRLP